MATDYKALGKKQLPRKNTEVVCHYLLFNYSGVFTYFVKPSERDYSYFVNSFQMKNSSL